VKAAPRRAGHLPGQVTGPALFVSPRWVNRPGATIPARRLVGSGTRAEALAAAPLARPELARRKPRLLLRLPGALLLRFADRTLRALLFQLPPRLTRLAPSPAEHVAS